jgi:hypothetical protein
MDRTYIKTLSPHSQVGVWEISPCVRLFDPSGDACVEAFETADLAEGEVFWGVYMCPRQSLVTDGSHWPARHIMDFDTFAEAEKFVQCINGRPDVTYVEEA